MIALKKKKNKGDCKYYTSIGQMSQNKVNALLALEILVLLIVIYRRYLDFIFNRTFIFSIVNQHSITG